ncbi:hypothetical protein U9M48_004770 [Paspalum notatum var. saurae]|uniref:Uncharacterized protein n=1 Tax=Paspalum notatum var. saurae TaxID=547442 RepID=A0AAQ3SJC0_PASNO
MPMKMGRRWTEGISRDDRLTSYPTATRPDIQFAVCLCARYQASPRTSHLSEIHSRAWSLVLLGSSLFLRGFSMPTMPAAGLTASQPPHMPTLRNLSCLLVLPQAS